MLVSLAEEGMIDNNVAREALRFYLKDLANEDTLLLGCTHFPVFTPLLKEMLPSNVLIVDSAKATALALQQELFHNNLLNHNPQGSETKYLVTDSINRFRKVGEVFLKQEILASDIELIDVAPGRSINHA